MKNRLPKQSEFSSPSNHFHLRFNAAKSVERDYSLDYSGKKIKKIQCTMDSNAILKQLVHQMIRSILVQLGLDECDSK